MTRCLAFALLALALPAAAQTHEEIAADTSRTAVLEPDSSASGKWDVSAPHGPTRAVRFETTEGTWMNLDVSPDGRTMVPSKHVHGAKSGS